LISTTNFPIKFDTKKLILMFWVFFLKKEKEKEKKKENSEREKFIKLNFYFCLVAVSITPANNKASYSTQNQVIHMLIDILEHLEPIPIPVSLKNYC